MEKPHPALPGSSPFFTRAIVQLSEDWLCPNSHAETKLGYRPRKDWRVAVREHLVDLGERGFPWLNLAQTP